MFDYFKFSIYASCIKIAIAGNHAPVRLAWVPFLRVPKNGFIYVKADNKNVLQDLWVYASTECADKFEKKPLQHSIRNVFSFGWNTI